MGYTIHRKKDGTPTMAEKNQVHVFEWNNDWKQRFEGLIEDTGEKINVQDTLDYLLSEDWGIDHSEWDYTYFLNSLILAFEGRVE